MQHFMSLITKGMMALVQSRRRISSLIALYGIALLLGAGSAAWANKGVYEWAFAIGLLHTNENNTCRRRPETMATTLYHHKIADWRRRNVP